MLASGWHYAILVGISTIYENLGKIKIATVIAVVFAIGGTLLNLVIWPNTSSGFANSGGPTVVSDEAIVSEEVATGEVYSLLASNTSGSLHLASGDQENVSFLLVDEASLLNSANPLSTLLPSRDGLMIYKVKSGDTLSKIAADFDISLNTILWANRNIGRAISAGQELVILPVSGVIHRVAEDGVTLESVASLYGIPTGDIAAANPHAADGPLAAGTNLIIPGGKPNQKYLASLPDNNLPNLAGYFIQPVIGWNWGVLHPNNAVDIANACGTPIRAAAEGLVVDEQSSGWNDGYGNYVLVEHPNGTVTRYAHNESNVVSVGNYVLQGDLIAYVGNTGNTHGPTGCHLHFEVRGAKNPFVK